MIWGDFNFYMVPVTVFCTFKKSVACRVIFSVLAPFGANLEFFLMSVEYVYIHDVRSHA